MMKYLLARMVGHFPIEFKGRHRLISNLYSENSRPAVQKVIRLEGTDRYICVNSRNHIGWNILMYGCYEKNMIKTMKRLLQNSRCRVALDIGANIGQYSLILSEIFEQVYSFEPILEFREQLTANIDLNRIDNIEVIPFALGSGRNNIRMALLIDHDEPQTASVDTGNYSFKDLFGWKFQAADMLSLDEFVKDRSLNNVDYMKIDTDGSEWDVLRGARETLINFQPLVQIELVESAKKWNCNISQLEIARF